MRGPLGLLFRLNTFFSLSLSTTTYFATERYFFFGLTFFFYLVSALYKDGEYVDGNGWGGRFAEQNELIPCTRNDTRLNITCLLASPNLERDSDPSASPSWPPNWGYVMLRFTIESTSRPGAERI